MTIVAKPGEPEIGKLPREALASMSGVELLEGIRSGTLPQPPFAATTRISLIKVEEGRIAFEGEPSSAFMNPLGSIHGGWIATLLDSAMGCAVHSRLAAGQGFSTIDMTVSFVRAIKPDAPRVRCEARLLHLGGRIGTAEGRVFEVATGALIAHGQETCLIVTGVKPTPTENIEWNSG